MNTPAWSCTVTAEADGLLLMRFHPTAATMIAMTPAAARALACKLLLVAESAEQRSSESDVAEAAE